MLPQPVQSFPIVDEFKGKVEELPGSSGGLAVRGNFHKFKTINIVGLYGKHKVSSFSETLTELDMFDLHRDLLEFLKPSSPSSECELFMYYDSASSTYRKYKRCVKTSLSTGIGDGEYASKIFSMNLQMVILDPVMYSTAPGA